MEETKFQFVVEDKYLDMNQEELLKEMLVRNSWISLGNNKEDRKMKYIITVDGKEYDVTKYISKVEDVE